MKIDISISQFKVQTEGKINLGFSRQSREMLVVDLTFLVSSFFIFFFSLSRPQSPSNNPMYLSAAEF